MKVSELRQKSIAELQKMLEESRKKLGQFRFDLASGKIKSIQEIRKIKKEIAQVLTILREKRDQKLPSSNKTEEKN